MGFVVFLVFLLIYVVQAQNTPGDEFLDRKEADIQMMSRMVEQNIRNGCELLATCTTTGSNCTRHECWHSLSDLENKVLTCQNVKQSRWCGDTCGYRNFDFTKSYVRLSPTTDTGSMGTTMSICSQRALDPYFKQVSSPSDFVRVYFGHPSGTWRGFPGTDENECRNYDPRPRPWYLTSTSVKKIVIILVDTGASMGDSLSRGLPRNKTCFTSVKHIAREFLDTLLEPDSVMIIQFNAAAAVPLADKPVQVITNETTYPPPHPELAGLKTALNNLKVAAEPGASNITSAIEKAESFLSAYGPDYLKIILALSDGEFAMSGRSVPLPPTFTNGTNAKTFAYIVPSVNYKNFSNNAFPNQLCAVGGSFEELSLDRVTNPLYSIASFYSFMANLHATLMNGKVDYTQVFSDFTQINGDKFSVSKPAFGPGGELVGVASITIYLTDLGTRGSSVLTALSKRSAGVPYNAANFPLGPANCSIRLATSSSEFSCGSHISIPANGSLCEPGSTTNNIQDLSCCGTCILGPSPSNDKNNVKTIFTNIVAPVLSAVIGLVACVFIARCRRKKGYLNCCGNTGLDIPPYPEVLQPRNEGNG